jgi:uncharacterized protein involved in type VI secretion and phage assembly
MSFSPRFNPTRQPGQVQVRGVNPHAGQEVVAQSEPEAAQQGDDIVHQLLRDFGVRMGERILGTTQIRNVSEARKVVEAEVRSSTEDALEGSGTCVGEVELLAGRRVEIRGLGKRLSGHYQLSQVTHTISQAGFQTSFSISSRTATSLLSTLRTVQEKSPRPDRPEPLYGLLIGEVVSTNDPENLGRVQVRLPDLAEQSQTDFVPVATWSAGEQLGSWFVPQVNEHVVVAFIRGDVNRPVVLGSLWSIKRTPPDQDPALRRLKFAGDLFIETSGSLTLTGQNGIQITTQQGVDVKVGAGQSMNVES